jgi:hypothetical protein
MKFSWYEVTEILTILFPLVCSIIKRKEIPATFLPFFILLWISALFTYLTMALQESSAVSANIYVLVEPIFVLWLLYNWGRLHGKWINPVSIFIFLLAVWITDNFIIHNIRTTNSIYRVAYAFILVFISLEHINYQIVSVRDNLFKDSSFIIAVTFVILYAYKATLETFFMLHIQMSNAFAVKLFLILQVVTYLTNVIFGLAILWIHKKQKFTLPY